MSDKTPQNPPLLLVSEMYPPAMGGSAVLLESIYSRLQDRFNITVLTDRDKCTGDEAVRGRIAVERTEIRKWRRGIVSREDRSQHWALGRTIKRLSRTMSRDSGGTPVIAHCGRAMPEALAALTARRLMLGPRMLCWAHGEEITTARVSREYTFVMTRVYRACAGIIANSEHTAAMVKAYGVPDGRVHVVHPGVDTDLFNPGIDGSELRRKYVPPGRLMVLTVGRFPPRKGHDTTLRALAKLRDHSPVLHYVIAGDGEGDERARLERLVDELNLRDRVTFAGMVRGADLPRFYAACDLFVMPNRREGSDVEGFGIVFLEAAACGKPTIGGRSGGVPEAVGENETGLLVGGTDADELATAIAQLAGDEGLRRRMGEAGRKRVVERFTWPRAAEAVAGIHNGLLGR
ncbi:MAG: glycosyltransferase family 4 protein [Planctomycetes bacterium]|nr:glycosyltransferase family 4 protein [Planctomycetota bacterium]